MTAVEADFYGPYDEGKGADARAVQWRAFMSRFVTSGVARSVGDELLPYAVSEGMFVRVKTGEVIAQGTWGQNTVSGGGTGEKKLPVAPADSSLTRVDRIVARANFTAETVEFEVVPGSPGAGVPLAPTRNTVMYEITLGWVTVGAGVTNITAANVTVSRQWGGPVYPTVTDDFAYYGDKMSSCPRSLVSQGLSVASGFLYLVRMQSAIEQTITRLSLYVDVAQVGGSFLLGIFKGDHQRSLQRVGSPVLPIGAPGSTVKTVTISPLQIEAGRVVAVGMLALGSTTVPKVGSSSDTMPGLLTSGGNMVTAYRGSTSSMPTSVDLLDGTWTGRDQVPWVALG